MRALSTTARLEWGPRGAREAAMRGDIVIIVDILSFSSTVTTALGFGAIIHPHQGGEDTRLLSERTGASVTVGRAEAVHTGSRSLSPLSFTPEDRGKAYILCSPNGATCCQQASQAPVLLIGCLLNANAAAQKALHLQKEIHRPICVVACGERWKGTGGEDSLRPCLEDFLGAGAVLAHLPVALSPDALVCREAFLSCRHGLAQLIADGPSGLELIENGFEEDVRYCTRLDEFGLVPMLSEGRFEPPP